LKRKVTKGRRGWVGEGEMKCGCEERKKKRRKKRIGRWERRGVYILPKIVQNILNLRRASASRRASSLEKLTATVQRQDWLIQLDF
jgi:hypothetical protein